MFKTVIHWLDFYDGSSSRFDSDSNLGKSFDSLEHLALYHRSVFINEPFCRSVLCYVLDNQGGYRHVTITRDDYTVVSHHHFTNPLNFLNYVKQKQN